MVNSEDVIGKRIGEYKLIDQNGKEFNTSAFMGRPFVVSFIFTSCIHICPTITLSLSSVVKEKLDGIGKDFNILTVSFDPERDTPQKLKEFGSSFTNDFSHWKFTTADKETIAKMARDFGFFYRKEGSEFQHINMVSVVGANGDILTHVYGIDFKPNQVLNAIYYPERFKGRDREGKQGKLSGLLEKVVLFCYKYDPATNSYKLDYLFLLRMTLEGVVLFSIFFWVWKEETVAFFSRMFGRKKLV